MSDQDNNAIFEVSLKFIIKDSAGKILLLKVGEGEPMAGYYDLPGGRIKESEKAQSLNASAQRELTEEIGSEVQLVLQDTPVAIGRHHYPPRMSGQPGWVFWIAFEASYQSGEIIISDEHASYDWINMTEKDLPTLFVNGPLEVMTHYITGKLV